MNACHQWEKRLKDYLAGEISAGERARLLAHARECPDCGGVLALHRRLAEGEPLVELPAETEFRDMRRGVLSRIAGGAERRGRPSLVRDLTALFRMHPALAAGLAATFLVAVFLAGRWSVQTPPDSRELLVGAIQAHARQQKGLTGYWDAPFVYSNVAFRPEEGGRLALSFDVTQRVSLVTATDSPLAKEILVHAILDPSGIGPRLKAMALSEQIADRRLAEALVFALHNDPSLAVRRKALAVLARYPSDPVIESALLVSLQRDESVQIRLEALDVLAARKVDPETIREAIGERDRPGDAAVLQEAMNRLRM